METAEKIKINDESGDRRYFTIIPNYVLNHSTLWDREVYIQMKRIAGEGGTCWFSQTKLAKQCGVSINRLKKSIKYLLEHNWVKFKGKKIIQTKGGNQEVNEYAIIDLWKMNNSFYEAKGVSPGDIPESQRGITDEAKGVSPGDDKEEPLEEEPLLSQSDSWDFLRELEKMRSGQRKDLKIIALYWKTKGWKFENRKQFEAALGRELKPAKTLTGYTGEQVGLAIKHCQNKYPDMWTLETCHKRITDLINK